MRDDTGLDQSDGSRDEGKWAIINILEIEMTKCDDEPAVDFARK